MLQKSNKAVVIPQSKTVVVGPTQEALWCKSAEKRKESGFCLPHCIPTTEQLDPNLGLDPDMCLDRPSGMFDFILLNDKIPILHHKFFQSLRKSSMGISHSKGRCWWVHWAKPLAGPSTALHSPFLPLPLSHTDSPQVSSRHLPGIKSN